jgi:hypothetical protein
VSASEFLESLARVPARELAALGHSLCLGRPLSEPLGKLGVLFCDVADGADQLTAIRARHWLRIMALPTHEELRATLLERLAGAEAPWSTVCAALRAVA